MSPAGSCYFPCLPLLPLFATLLAPTSSFGATNDWGNPAAMDRQAVIERTMLPFSGSSQPGVNTKTLTGKVMSGYQGWFNAPEDGAGQGWSHWSAHGRFEPGACKIDFWPDMTELDADERFVTPFVHADGRPAEVFSSFNRKTVLRHFKWMQDYDLDGVFVQRFITSTFDARALRHVNVVLSNCREGANLYGRAYAVMYDLSGLGSNQMQRVMDDWRLLMDRMQITKDPAYLHHGGKPVVSVWGLGFNDGRKYTLSEGLQLVKFLKDDPQYGGNTVVLGVPTHWRTLSQDALNDPTLHELVLKADIVSPWTVARYSDPEQANRYAEGTMKPDIEWCRERNKEYLPVVFPGFSWHNMYPRSPLNQIPRLKGKFLWTQYIQARKAGASMVYQAMFDEVDEGTAIFKCTDDPPVGLSKFVNYEGLPSDFYLKMVGQAGRMLRGQPYILDGFPERN